MKLPGKSSAELEKDREELMRKVEEDLKVWCRPPHRAKSDFTGLAIFAFGFALGVALVLWLL